jgi:hypothetical protein
LTNDERWKRRGEPCFRSSAGFISMTTDNNRRPKRRRADSVPDLRRSSGLTPEQPGNPRAGWEEAFRRMAECGDVRLIDGDWPATEWDLTEWEW